MKLTKDRLKQIIKEELEEILGQEAKVKVSVSPVDREEKILQHVATSMGLHGVTPELKNTGTPLDGKRYGYYDGKKGFELFDFDATNRGQMSKAVHTFRPGESLPSELQPLRNKVLSNK